MARRARRLDERQVAGKHRNLRRVAETGDRPGRERDVDGDGGGGTGQKTAAGDNERVGALHAGGGILQAGQFGIQRLRAGRDEGERGAGYQRAVRERARGHGELQPQRLRRPIPQQRGQADDRLLKARLGKNGRGMGGEGADEKIRLGVLQVDFPVAVPIHGDIGNRAGGIERGDGKLLNGARRIRAGDDKRVARDIAKAQPRQTWKHQSVAWRKIDDGAEKIRRAVDDQKAAALVQKVVIAA